MEQLFQRHKVIILKLCWKVYDIVQHCSTQDVYQGIHDNCHSPTTITISALIHLGWSQTAAANHKNMCCNPCVFLGMVMQAKLTSCLLKSSWFTSCLYERKFELLTAVGVRAHMNCYTIFGHRFSQRPFLGNVAVWYQLII